jgi:hypothetical protein
MIDFPSAPAVGDIVSAPSGVQWRWDGTTWLLASQGGGARGQVAYAQITATQGGFGGTAIDVAGLTVTFNAVAGRRYKVTAELIGGASAAGEAGAFHIMTAAGAIVQTSTTYLGLASAPMKMHQEVVVSPAAGPVTYKVQYVRTAGTSAHAVYADPQFPSFILVEDITFEAGSSAAPTSALPVAQANLTALGLTGSFQAIPFTLGFNTAPTDITLDNAAGRFTVTKAGKYRASWHYTVNAAAANANAYVHAYCEHMVAGGGSALRQIESLVGSATVYLTVSGSVVFDMAAGEIARCTASTTNTPTTTAIRMGVFSLERVA